LVTANEADLIEDGGVRSQVMVYELQDAEPSYPTLRSGIDDQGRPIGWGALSGLAADPEIPGLLYAVNDSFYGMQPTIFTIDTTETPAAITAATRVTRAGYPAQKLDLEGVAADGEGGFWLASEGRTDRVIPHALYHVDSAGEIDEEIGFPEELMSVERRFGAEGITRVGEGDDMTLWIAIQREWRDDEKGTVKLVSYEPASETWGAVRYPLDSGEKGGLGFLRSPPMAMASISSSGTTRSARRPGSRGSIGYRSATCSRPSSVVTCRWSRRNSSATFFPIFRRQGVMWSTRSKVLRSIPQAMPSRSLTMTGLTTAPAKRCS
jgi:hypothetical protein